MKTWKQTIDPLIKKYKTQTDKIFADFNKEIKAKKLSSTAETNELWRSKYADKFKKAEEKHHSEYKAVWTKFYSK